MEKYLFRWLSNVGYVYSSGVVFEFNENPNFSFEYDTIEYNTETGEADKLISGKRTALIKKEITEIKTYCDNFANDKDYTVHAYDPNDGNLYKGDMLKSEATTKGYLYRILEAPENLTAAWVDDGSYWKVYTYAIRDDGALLSNISTAKCSRCVLFFTEEEWEAHSKPVHSSDRWDFVNEVWKDTRDIAEVRKALILRIRNKYEGTRWQKVGAYVPAYEQETWNIQLEEARAWQKDNTADTPYIDTFLAKRTDASKPTKAELVADIIANHNAYVVAMAEVNAEQWGFIKQAQAATTLDELDALAKEVK